MARRQEASMTITIDTEEVAAEVLLRAIQGLRRSAEFCLGRAKYHAPVRAIFHRTRRGRPFPKGRDVSGMKTKGWRYIRSQGQYDRFMASKERRFGMNLPVEGGHIKSEQSGGTYSSEYYRQDRSVSIAGQRQAPRKEKGTPPRPTISGYTSRSRAAIGGMGTQFSGHANTLFPVFRQAGGRRVTGDFRRVAPLDQVFQQRGSKRKTGLFPSLASQAGTPSASMRAEAISGRASMLSAAGKRELKSRRALWKGKIGGRLRDEIYVSEPRKRGKFIWMDVTSPTEYAIHQEFGTTHHRPAPFLRPALYESREVLRREIRDAIKKPVYTHNEQGQRVFRMDRGGDARTSSRKREVN